jgi:hypothetical protein
VRMVRAAISSAPRRLAATLLRSWLQDRVLVGLAALGRAGPWCRHSEHGRHQGWRSRSVHTSPEGCFALGPSVPHACRAARRELLLDPAKPRTGDGAGRRAAPTLSRSEMSKTPRQSWALTECCCAKSISISPLIRCSPGAGGAHFPRVSTVYRFERAPQRACKRKRGYVVFFALDEQEIPRVLAPVLAAYSPQGQASVAPSHAATDVETRPIRQSRGREQSVRGSDAGNVGAAYRIIAGRRTHPPLAGEKTARRRGCASRRRA